MPGKKTLTMGITVNLNNYENLRLEVAGEVESQEDADELAGFLDGMLARLGRGDEATAERVDAYRHRVFSTEIAAEPEPSPEPPMKEQTVLVTPDIEEEETEEAAPAPEPEPEPEPEPITPAPAPEQPAEPAPAPVTPTESGVAEPMTSPAPAPAPEEPAEPAHAQAPQPAPAAGEVVCEECGALITKTQKQMSQLFLNKTLCKGCMDKLTHPQ